MLHVPTKGASRFCGLRFSSSTVSTAIKTFTFSDTAPSRSRHRARVCHLSRVPYRTSSFLKESRVQTGDEVPSKRRQFKDVPVHPSILSYIRTIGVGKPNRHDAKRRERQGLVIPKKRHPLQQRRKNRNSSSKEQASGKSNLTTSTTTTTTTTTPPVPFGPKARPVKIISSVSQVQQQEQQNYGFPANYYRIPEVALVGRSNVGKSALSDVYTAVVNPGYERY